MAVRVSIPAAPTTVEPGKGSTCDIKVGNSASTDVTVRLEISGEAASWALILPPELCVPAGGAAVAQVVFHVPRAPYPAAGLSRYRIDAASLNDSGDRAAQDAFLIIGPFTDTGVELVPAVSAGGPTEHAFRLTNRGNTEVRAAISAVVDGAGTTIDAQPSMLTVRPGETGTATVQLAPRRRLIGGGTRTTFRVTASPDGAAPVEAHGVIEPKHRPSRRLPPVIIAVATSLIVGLVANPPPFWSRDKLSTQEVVAEALQNTARVPGSRVSITLEAVDSAALSDPSRFRLEGAVDYRRNVGRYTVDVDGVEGEEIGGTVDVIKSPSGLYLRMPDGSSSRLARRWLVLSPEELSGLPDPRLDSLDESASAALAAAISTLGVIPELFQMANLATDVTPAGQRSYHGETVDAYHLDVGSDVLPLSQILDAGATVDHRGADVLVDGRDRARQLVLSFGASVTDAEGPRSIVVSWTMEAYDFGAAVNLDEPSGDQVVSLSGIAALPPR